MPAIGWGASVAPGPRVAMDVIQSVDVYATLMEFAGLPL
jgi:arylsulfatase A-like enzyme